MSPYWQLLFYGPLLTFWCLSLVALVMGLSNTRRVMGNSRGRRTIIVRMVAFTAVFILFLSGSVTHRLLQITGRATDWSKYWDSLTVGT